MNLKNNISNIFQVTLIKHEKTGLGFLLQQRDKRPYFRIWELCKDGAAANTKKIRKGDILLRVNSCDLATMTYEKGKSYFYYIIDFKLHIKSSYFNLYNLIRFGVY